MTTKHTPTPWVRDGYNLAAILKCVIPKGNPNAKHITGDYETIVRCEGDNWDANSKFIVNVVNNHDTLISTLKASTDILEILHAKSEHDETRKLLGQIIVKNRDVLKGAA